MNHSTRPAGRCHGNRAFGSALLAAGVLFLASTSFVRADSCPEPAVRIEATAGTPLTEVPYAENSFWSITVYDADGVVASEPFVMNSSFTETNANRDTVLNFGADASAENYLPVYPGWNATLRIYTPQEAYFNGSWVRPELQLKN